MRRSIWCVRVNQFSGGYLLGFVSALLYLDYHLGFGLSPTCSTCSLLYLTTSLTKCLKLVISLITYWKSYSVSLSSNILGARLSIWCGGAVSWALLHPFCETSVGLCWGYGLWGQLGHVLPNNWGGTMPFSKSRGEFLEILKCFKK